MQYICDFDGVSIIHFALHQNQNKPSPKTGVLSSPLNLQAPGKGFSFLNFKYQPHHDHKT
jgi:hypothetical protein